MAEVTVAVFDVNETLSDMAPLADRFVDVGAPPQLAKTWFAALLRDGFALTSVGATEKFATLGEDLLREALGREQLNRDIDDAVEHIMSGFQSLDVHPDVPAGVRKLRQNGLRLVTLSNGSMQIAERLLTQAGIRNEFEELLSVESAGIWKPAKGAYEYASMVCDVQLAQMMLIAVHPWDIDGAARAGMATAWINRAGGRYPRYFTAPQVTANSVTDLADRLAG